MGLMRITGLASTDLFTGTEPQPRQVIRVTLAEPGPGPVAVTVTGPGVRTPEPATVAGSPQDPAGQVTAEVGVEIAAPHGPLSRLRVTATADDGTGRAALGGEITAAEPGWTMWMVSHFHYDPVWWNTQGQFTESRLLLPDSSGRLPDARTAFELVRLHLDEARRDQDYKFVLAELDYLKPHFDAHPEDRADLLAFIASGRVEIVGGSYNEPNTNLTTAESTIRNAVYGLAYQRDVLGADPQSAWMLDAFGFDPGYPGLMAAAGLTSSAWARGPFHQWGPRRSVGDNTRMQFASEFEWVSPDGRGLLTAYMPNHYGAGWVTQDAQDLAAAEQAAYQEFSSLAPVAATRNVLLPVGADHVIPSRWAAAIHRDWNARYAWPRFVTALPREFFAAVRRDAGERGVWISPQTRDMNPVYPGKDVSYIDTKQGQRAAEAAVEDGERLATLAWLAGHRYPAAELDKAWRQLVYGAHHDAITGTEGDQVYLDLLAGWQEAHQRGTGAAASAAAYLAGLVDTTPPPGVPQDSQAVVVLSTQSAGRAAGLATAALGFAAPGPPWLALADDQGAPVPFLAAEPARHADGTLASLTVTFRARDVPALGYRTYWAAAAPLPPGGGSNPAGWAPVPGTVIANEALEAEADPAAGGTLSRVTDIRTGTEVLAGPGNELVIQDEYDYHPQWGEGPWLLSPKGPGTGTAARPAGVRAERCPIGSRLVTETSQADLRITTETILWDGSAQLCFRTHVDGSIGQDRLLRVRFPVLVPGALPVYQSALTAVGRPFGAAGTDVAEHWYTLDNPAHEWFGLSSAARVTVTGPGGERHTTAIGVAEVVAPDDPAAVAGPLRGFVAALAARGVTATCSRPGGPRYGAIDLDSNLPDVRIAVGGPDDSAFTARVLAGAGPGAAELLTARLAAGGPVWLWLPAAQARDAAFAPGADVRGDRDLPVLILAGQDLAGALRAAAGGLAVSAGIEAAGTAAAGWPGLPSLAGYSAALLNRGTPSSLVSPDGTLHIALMRACSAWPSGVWIDGEKRTAPDGTSFAWQHWSHTFEYALAAGPGDWREAGFAQAGLEYQRDLHTVVTGRHAGPLPPRASLASAEPATAVLTALKPHGHPLAAGRDGTPDPAAGVTVRLRDVSGGGGPATARFRLHPGITAAAECAPTEEPGGRSLPVRDGAAQAELPAAGTVTFTVQPQPWPGGNGHGGSGGAAPVPAEPAQPVFTRYWLHGKGPAPAGSLPVAVHLSGGTDGGAVPGGAARLALAAPDGDGDPATGDLSTGDLTTGDLTTGTIVLTVACGTEPAAGQIDLDVPPGLTAEPAGPLRYDLPALGHARWELRVGARPGAAGRYFLAAGLDGPGGLRVEDAALVTVGEPAAPRTSLPAEEFVPLFLADQAAATAEIGVTVDGASLAAGPGGTAEIVVRLASGAASELRGEAQLVSPFGSWARAEPWTQGFTLAPGGEQVLRFRLRVPAGARPGEQTWAVVKVMYFGRIRYSPVISCRIADHVHGETIEALAPTSERP
jgi:alpha-mannosidase